MVVCIRDPEVAVRVTVDVPAGTGFGLVAALVPPHPAMKPMTKRSDRIPPPKKRELRNFFRFRMMGNSAAKPMGVMAPSATNSFVGAPCRCDVE